MANNSMDTDLQREENGGQYTLFPTLQRERKRVRVLIGRSRCHRPTSPPPPGRGLLVVGRGGWV